MLTLKRSTFSNSAIVGVLIGAVFFLCVFGVRILNPTYIAWQLHDDPAHLYLGWEYFRHESWHFPFGKIAGYGTPEGSSIFYTDSIPLFAFIFKCLRWALPEPFQYTGLWMLCCYMLQGFFGWLLSALHTHSKYLRMLMTGLFVLSPSMLDRSNRHHALIAHWLILAALYLGIQGYESFRSRHPQWSWKWSWVLSIVISGLVHLYLCFMVVIIYLSSVFVFISRARRRHRRTYWSAMLPFPFLLAAVYLEGGLVVGSDGWAFASWQFSLFSMNLLAPLVPLRFDKASEASYVSYFLSSQKVPNAGYHEGFNYLGLGVLALILLALIVASYVVIRRSLKTAEPHSQRRVGRGPLVATTIACCFLAFLSLSNEIRLGQNSIAVYRLGHIADHFAAVFRSSGRFFWPIGYLLLWLALRPIGLLARHRLQLATALLQGALTLQLVDLSTMLKHVGLPYQKVVQFDTQLKSKFWADTIPRYRNIFYYPAGDSSYYVPLGLVAAPNGVGINAAPKSRSNPNGDHGENGRLTRDLEAGRLRSDTLYVFKDKSLLEKLKNKLPHDRYILSVVDDFCVAARAAVKR